MQRFETDRLTVSCLSAGDRLAQALPALVTPDVTAFLPPHLQAVAHPNPQSWLMRLRSESKVYTVSDTGSIVGLLTLHHASAQQIMLGYLFAQTAWGKGYATELVCGFVTALNASGWRGTVLGGVDPGNMASARVLEKAGFEDIGDSFFQRIF